MPLLTLPTITPGSLSATAQPVIAAGPDMVLRPWKLTDGPGVLQAFADPGIQRWHVRSAGDLDEVRDWISTWQAGWAMESDLNWAIADRGDDSVVGRVSLKGVDHRDGTAGVAYWMAPKVRGRGWCPMAVDTLCTWAFQ